ncbi:hypothetical protein PSYJA_26979 [Pseudomonas syringae pv. japonica str. M301072]|uniref:Uncharacterized protein n=1 Tax=Pseudomonas syringae pv. japonica str. M301072 TaxID=629262 RepID=F3FQB2_PSESX|nr:hypothetical protein PSYJA_26979 [Pseudomonas syringae pv. japonica str. M301072]
MCIVTINAHVPRDIGRQAEAFKRLSSKARGIVDADDNAIHYFVIKGVVHG